MSAGADGSAGTGPRPKETAVERPTRERILFWRVSAGIAVPIIETFVRLRVRPGDSLPKEGAFILAPNHYSDFDPLAVASFVWRMGRTPRFLAKASLFRVPLLGRFLKGLQLIPVERASRSGPNPLSAAHDLVEAGFPVIIYPEGTLTRQPDLWPMRGKTGTVRAALDSGIPLIPAATWGAQDVLPRWSKRISMFPRHTVTMAIGEPLDLSPWVDRPRDSESLNAATEALMAAITALVADLRGEQPPADRWDPAAHGQTEYGRP